MMKCPVCGRPVVVGYEDGKLTCRLCGWGSGTAPTGVKRSGPSRAAEVGTVVLLWVVLVGLVVGLYYVVFNVNNAEPNERNIALFAGALVLYMVLGWFLRPSVDTGNLGWAGGLIDRPFAISDNWERAKLKILFVFYPGRLMAAAFVGLVRLVRGRRDS